MGAPAPPEPAKFVMRSTDLIKIMVIPPTIIPAIMAPVPLIGTALNLLIQKQPACLLGDEIPPVLRLPLPYTSPPYTVPGVGTLIIKLGPDNLTKQTLKGGRPILLKGMIFDAIFTVTGPATLPPPVSTPDSQVVKKFTAQFVTTNVTTTMG